MVTGGQLLSGIEEKNAIGVTALAEGLICIVATLAYVSLNGRVNWMLAPYLIVGSVISVPLSAITVKRLKTKRLRILIGVMTAALGILILTQVFI